MEPSNTRRQGRSRGPWSAPSPPSDEFDSSKEPGLRWPEGRQAASPRTPAFLRRKVSLSSMRVSASCTSERERTDFSDRTNVAMARRPSCWTLSDGDAIKAKARRTGGDSRASATAGCTSPATSEKTSTASNCATTLTILRTDRRLPAGSPYGNATAKCLPAPHTRLHVFPPLQEPLRHPTRASQGRHHEDEFLVPPVADTVRNIQIGRQALDMVGVRPLRWLARDRGRPQIGDHEVGLAGDRARVPVWLERHGLQRGRLPDDSCAVYSGDDGPGGVPSSVGHRRPDPQGLTVARKAEAAALSQPRAPTSSAGPAGSGLTVTLLVTTPDRGMASRAADSVSTAARGECRNAVASVARDADAKAVRVFLERAVRLADSPSSRAREPREGASDTRAGGSHRHGRRGSTVALRAHSGRERA